MFHRIAQGRDRDPDGEEQRQPNEGSEIKRLVTTAGEDGEPDSYTGKRGSTRFAVGMQLDVCTDRDIPACAWPVTMHNISDGGFAFWSKRQLRMSSDIWVREFSADNSAPWLEAHVTHCTVGIKGYLVGAEFGSASGGSD